MPRDYKDTVLLPDSDFPMKADLARREPDWLRRWRDTGLYDEVLARPTDKRFVLHDGPPYANGHMHNGHVLNNSLKDFVTRFRNLVGERSRFVPGWDCHGLPIELNVDRKLGAKKREMTVGQIREECRREAEKWQVIQSEERQRLGVLGTWDEPYLTMKPPYEAAVIRALKAFAERGLIYRGKKPVQWCANDRTALAESEVEYIEKHVSPSVYVKFAASDTAARVLRERFSASKAERFFAVIWTTTPWTLPANLAIALHPEVEYTVLDVPRGGTVEGWLVAAPLAKPVLDAARVSGVATDGSTVRGEKLVGLEFRHPWEDRASALVAAMYVETDTGTGLVHTAPGHGRDDYVTGIKHGLEAYAPLDDAGRYTDELGAGSQAMGLVGKSVWEANPIIVQAMAERGVLVNAPTDKVTHKYPGCWRCHKPLITRATTQWFIALDQPMKGIEGEPTLRERALSEIERLSRDGDHGPSYEGDARGWVPAWGRERIAGMIGMRPDWCISRQRVWGVPIPALHCETCQHATLSPALLEHVATVFAQHGAGAWYDDKIEVVPHGFACEKCGVRGAFTRDQSIVDVWFESGSSFYAVCEGKPDLGVPVDLYLEGSDQHRGWFHSSLLVGVALHGRAPFKTVLTHGFVMDENGEALSKSVINERKARGEDVSHFDPQLMIKQNGGELLRAWSAYEDFRGDVRLSKEHFAQVTDAYRRVRNAFRFMLQVMRRKPSPTLGEVTLLPFDRWALARVGQVVEVSEKAYRQYEFRSVFMGAVELLAGLSASYLDVIKDWLYNDTEQSPRRRSTLAAVDAILRAMATVLAPILPFTAEDVWDHLPKRATDLRSVHLGEWPRISVGTPADVGVLLRAGSAVEALRERVHGALEPVVQAWGVERQAAKKAGREPGAGDAKFADEVRIDHSRDAEAIVTAPDDVLAALAPLRDVLAESLILGHLELQAGAAWAVTVRRAPYAACERCWRRRKDVDKGGLCARCAEAVRIHERGAGA